MSTMLSRDNKPSEATYECEGETFPEVKALTTTGLMDVDFTIENLRSVTLTYSDGMEAFPILNIIDMIDGGKPAYPKFEDCIPCFLLDIQESEWMSPQHDQTNLFNKVAPKQHIQGSIAQTLYGKFPNDDSTITCDELAQVCKFTVGARNVQVSLKMIKECCFAFLGVSCRLARHPQSARLDYWTNSRLRNTVSSLFPQVDLSILSAMISRAQDTGVFDLMQQGSRWSIDHAFYMLWARNSTEGSLRYGTFCFFLVGSLGYQFSALGACITLGSKLNLQVMELLARIGLNQSLLMMRAVKNRKELLEAERYPWYLLCHCLSAHYKHDFSMTLFPVITYIVLYATQLLAGVDPDMAIPGIEQFLPDQKRKMEAIARELVKLKAVAQMEGVKITIKRDGKEEVIDRTAKPQVVIGSRATSSGLSEPNVSDVHGLLKD